MGLKLNKHYMLAVEELTLSDRSWSKYFLPKIMLFVILAAFFLFKLPFSGLPYYWDEAWSYAPAVHAMYESGPSLLPQSLPPELSRGHPLLFYFVASTWMNLFGEDRTIQHLFILLLSIATLISIYMLARELSSDWIGVIAAALTASCEPFLAQSSLLLPEMMLTLFSCLTMLFFIRQAPVGYILSASAALLVKESALVLVMAVIATEIVTTVIWRNDRYEYSHKSLLILMMPLFVISVFFIYQRFVHGWFFFPEHLGLMKFDLQTIIYKLKIIYYETFERQGMYVLTYALGFIIPILLRSTHWTFRLLLILLYIAAVKILFGRWTLPLLPTLILPIFLFVIICFLKFKTIYKMNVTVGRGCTAIFIFTCTYLLFTSLNFYTNRYLLVLYPLFIIMVLSLLYWLLHIKFRSAIIPASVLTMLLLISQIGADNDVGDARLSYRDDIIVHLNMIHYLEEQDLQNATFSGSFTLSYYMTDMRSGYLMNGQKFNNVTTQVEPYTRFLILSHSSNDDEDFQRKDFRMIKEFRSNNAWTALYERKTRGI